MTKSLKIPVVRKIWKIQQRKKMPFRQELGMERCRLGKKGR